MNRDSLENSGTVCIKHNETIIFHKNKNEQGERTPTAQPTEDKIDAID